MCRYRGLICPVKDALLVSQKHSLGYSQSKLRFIKCPRHSGQRDKETQKQGKQKGVSDMTVSQEETLESLRILQESRQDSARIIFYCFI